MWACYKPELQGGRICALGSRGQQHPEVCMGPRAFWTQMPSEIVCGEQRHVAFSPGCPVPWQSHSQA